MAESFSHKWGQIVGNVLQESIREALQEIASAHGLYLDYQRARPARPGKKVTWQDRHGNVHDLDYVLERGGSETHRGLPAAFIETAWRRYTKHSRNKAQEIQGAVLALAETYSHLHPFLGIVLAGVFTKGSLDQLRSCGFTVAYVPYDHIVRAFAIADIDASFDEGSKETAFKRKIQKFANLSKSQFARIRRALHRGPKATSNVTSAAPLTEFLAALHASLSRGVQAITVVVLHGLPKQVSSATQAIEYLHKYRDDFRSDAPALKFEISVRYNTGDSINAVFQTKPDAIRFLQGFVEEPKPET